MLISLVSMSRFMEDSEQTPVVPNVLHDLAVADSFILLQYWSLLERVRTTIDCLTWVLLTLMAIESEVRTDAEKALEVGLKSLGQFTVATRRGTTGSRLLNERMVVLRG